MSSMGSRDDTIGLLAVVAHEHVSLTTLGKMYQRPVDFEHNDNWVDTQDTCNGEYQTSVGAQ